MADVVAQGLLIMIIDGPEALPTGVLLIGKPLLLFPPFCYCLEHFKFLIFVCFFVLENLHNDFFVQPRVCVYIDSVVFTCF